MSNRLPMLPGERPSSVWQPSSDAPKPPWYRFNPHSRLSYLPLLLLGLIVAGLIVVFFATRKPVGLYVDGELVTTRTHARTVRGLLAARRIRLDAGDAANPPPETRVSEGMLVSVRRVRDVRLLVDGTTLIVRTRSQNPMMIVGEAGVTLSQGDEILVERVDAPPPLAVARYSALANEPALPMQIRVLRAQPVTLVDDDGQTRHVHTTAPTVGEALDALNVPLYEGDSLEPAFGTPLSAEMEIVIRRAWPVVVRDGETHVEARTRQTSVGGVLDELGLSLSGEDYSLPPPDAPLLPGSDVRVVRVEEVVLLEEETIPFETVWQPEPGLELDQHVELREGQAGVLQREITVRYEEGVEVSRTVRGEWVRQEPVDRLMGYGTQIVVRTVQTEVGQLDYWRHLHMLATSYTAATSGKEPGSPGYGITGTGLPAGYGIVAVDPRVINFFTQMYVPDYGVGLAADAGGAIKNMRIDLGYDEDNLELWYRWVDVYLLTPVPDPDDIIWVLPES